MSFNTCVPEIDWKRVDILIDLALEEDLGDIWTDVAKGDLTKVTGWLKDKIHRHASFIKPDELFRLVCGEFDAKYFTDYLTDKYTKLYELD